MKMIVLDLDGTLLTEEKTISKLTYDTLIKAQKQGIRVVLASGRPLSGILKYAYQLKLNQYNGYIIASNGAQLVRVNDMKTLWERVIKIDESKMILNHLNSFDVIPMISDDTYMYVKDVYENSISYNNEKINIIEYESRNGGFLLCEQKQLDEFLNFNLYKILVAGDPNYLKDNFHKISEPFDYNAMFTAPFYYEFTHKEADKGLGLKELCHKLEISLIDVIGFGDDLNDLPFLKIVGESVAMENANALIKDKVDAICGHNNTDGIGLYLKHRL